MKFAKDDVYFRDVLVASRNLETDSNAAKIRKIAARSLNRPEQQGLARYIRGSFVDVEIYSQGGIFLGQGVGLQFDQSRVNTVLERIVRGLFYEEKGKPVPSDYRVQVDLDQFGDRVKSSVHQTFGGKMPAPIRKELGSVFEYAALPQGSTSLWLGCFYKRVFFIGLVIPGAEATATR